MIKNSKESILGYFVDIKSVDTCSDEIMAKIEARICKSWLACFNPHSFAVARHDKSFSDALKAANWLLPDGVGIIIASMIFGGQIKSRITGSEIFHSLNARINDKKQMSVFFMGSTNEVLDKICENMSISYPNVKIAGSFSPPFKEGFSQAEIDEMVEKINLVKPDVLWVGMTAPKQEKWIFENIEKLDVHFIGAVGAVFDFFSGKIERPSVIFQKLYLEWLIRLIKQPTRLWQRTLISGPVFLGAVIVDKFRHLITE